MSDFATHLRQWRGLRRLSQMALAGRADVSPRHIAFLETGRSAPSRGMVLRLADALDLPLVARNELLHGAGFASQHRRSALSDAHMAPVRDAMYRLIHRHDPYPALVMDRLWRIRALNRAATRLFALAGLGEGDALLDMLTTPGRGAELIENWAEVGHHIMLRLRTESRASGGIDALDRAAALLSRDPAVAAFVPEQEIGPITSTIYRTGGLRLALFSSFVTFGGATDLTLAELQIELMFPADPDAEAILQELAKVDNQAHDQCVE